MTRPTDMQIGPAHAPATGLHVVHLVSEVFGHEGRSVGGAERYALELARAMALAGVRTSLVGFGRNTFHEKIGQLDVHILGKPWLIARNPHNPISAKMFTHLRSATVIHCHQRRLMFVSIAAIFGRLTNRRVFVSDMGGGALDLSRFIDTDFLFHGHLHISEYSRHINNHGSRANAHVILGGIDTKKFVPAPTLAVDGPVLFIGRLLPHKGIDTLIEGLPDGMPLEIVGRAYDDRYHNDLRRMAAGKNVKFFLDFDDAKLIETCQRSRCVVLPSVYNTMYGQSTPVPELLGQTLLEGMACGLPALTTDVASLPEVVDNGISGFVIPPNDPGSIRAKLQWWSDHPDEMRAMGQRARQRVLQHFTWAAVVDRCLQIYQGSPPLNRSHGSTPGN